MPDVLQRINSVRNLPEKIIVIYGVAYLLVGILLLTRKKIATTLANFVLSTSIIAWLFIVFTRFSPPRSSKVAAYGFSFFVVVLIICFLLYINNDKVQASANSIVSEGNQNEDILDVDL